MRIPPISESKDPAIKALIEYANGDSNLVEYCMMEAYENYRKAELTGGIPVAMIKAEIDEYNRKIREKNAHPVYAAMKAVTLCEDIGPHRQVIIDCLAEKWTKESK